MSGIELIAAIKADNNDEFLRIWAEIKSGYFDVEELKRRDEDGDTALHAAVLVGFAHTPDMITALSLIGRSAEIIKMRNAHGDTPLHTAVKHHRELVPAMLIALGIYAGRAIMEMDRDGNNVLHKAILKCPEQVSAILASSGPNLSEIILETNRNCDTCVHLAARACSVQLFAILGALNSGAEDAMTVQNIGSQDPRHVMTVQNFDRRQNPLHIVAETDLRMLGVMLAAAGESRVEALMQQDKDGRTPLHIVLNKAMCGYGRPRYQYLPTEEAISRIIEGLEERAPEVISVPEVVGEGELRGTTPLHLSIKRGYCTTLMLTTLRDAAPAAIAIQTQNGFTPLHFAARFNGQGVFNLLKAAGEQAADILTTYAIAIDGLEEGTPLHIAAIHCPEQVPEMMKALGDRVTDVIKIPGDGEATLLGAASFIFDIAQYYSTEEGNKDEFLAQVKEGFMLLLEPILGEKRSSDVIFNLAVQNKGLILEALESVIQSFEDAARIEEKIRDLEEALCEGKPLYEILAKKGHELDPRETGSIRKLRSLINAAKVRAEELKLAEASGARSGAEGFVAPFFVVLEEGAGARGAPAVGAARAAGSRGARGGAGGADGDDAGASR